MGVWLQGLGVLKMGSASSALFVHHRAHTPTQPFPIEGEGLKGQAAVSSELTEANAQSSQGVRAVTSAVSTVAPHQIRRPGGALA